MDKKVYNKIELQYIKEKDIIIFQQLRNGIMGQTMNLQGKGGRKISVAFDFKGKLHYGQPVQETGEQIVTVVSDRVCDEYIEELRQSGVGVVAVPVNGNELVLAMEQLAKDYGDGVWMLEGGANINAAFIQAGLVDEVSTVIYPAIDATKESPAI